MLGALAEPNRWDATTLRATAKKSRRGLLAAVRSHFERRLAACTTDSDRYRAELASD
jgi:hypothetical protein